MCKARPKVGYAGLQTVITTRHKSVHVVTAVWLETDEWKTISSLVSKNVTSPGHFESCLIGRCKNLWNSPVRKTKNDQDNKEPENNIEHKNNNP